MTYEQFLDLISRGPAPGHRMGQTIFNLLCATREDLSEKIRATDLDPFYDDDKIPAALAWLGEHWEVTDG